MDVPAVSVVMPVYNGFAYLRPVIRSVLDQSFNNFEFIIIDDGSKDDSLAVIGEFNDARIRLFSQPNQGLAATLNHGISLAVAPLVARQDQDDDSRPDRLKKQVEFLEANPNFALVGTCADILEVDKPTGRSHDHPTEDALIKLDLLFNNPFVHSSVMFRKRVVADLGGYCTDPKRQPPEDYELWSRLARTHAMANLPDRLLAYREVPTSMSRDGPNPFLEKVVMICAENLAFANGLATPDSACIDVAALTHLALHRMSEKPDLSTMCKRIQVAAESIWAATSTTSSLRPRFDERTAFWVRNLRHQYAFQLGQPEWTKPVTRPVLRALRAAARKFGIFRDSRR
jgi:glycosyltransferase involved in cell wall biosynthesis